MSEHEQEAQEPQQPEIILEPDKMAGVWANWAMVSHSMHEFTLDFVRMDGSAAPPGRGIVVARVSVSPLLVSQLIDALNQNWQMYAEKALPPEARGDEPTDDYEPGAGEARAYQVRYDDDGSSTPQGRTTDRWLRSPPGHQGT